MTPHISQSLISNQPRSTNSRHYSVLWLWLNIFWQLMLLETWTRSGVQAQPLSSTLDLASLMATQGLLIQGAKGAGNAGSSVSGAGDVNGDGISDVIVAARWASPVGRKGTGTAYVIYGSRNRRATLDLNDTLDTTQGMLIEGVGSMDYDPLECVSGAGDLNGDGISDMVVGSPWASPLNRTSPGAAYVIYGSRNLPAVLDLKNIGLNKTQGMLIAGTKDYDKTGFYVSSAGDMNDDGIDDLVVGVPSAFGFPYLGAAYVIYGSRSLPAVLDLQTFNITQGLQITGEPQTCVGASVSRAGDVNNDGISDLLLGTSGIAKTSVAYVVYGSRNLPAVLDLQTLNRTQGMKISRKGGANGAGASLSGAGDVNGDGISDMVVGRADSWLCGAAGFLAASPLGRVNAGGAYVIYGSRNLPAELDLQTLNRTQGMAIVGSEEYDYTGISVSGAGDFNNDTLDDIVVGSYADPLDRSSAGAVYVIYGSPSLPEVLDLNATLNTVQGLLIREQWRMITPALL